VSDNTEKQFTQKEVDNQIKEAVAKALKDNSGSENGKFTQEQIDSQIKSAVAEAVSNAKVNLDKAYEARDEALGKVATFEQEKRDADIQRLKDEGKHKEAHERELAEERTKREAAEKRNVELTRDTELRKALGGYDFRNKNATDMAYKEIVGKLVQDENGSWVSSDGKSIDDAVKGFSSDESNAFLFNVKANSGSGTEQPQKPSTQDKPRSLFEMDQSEVLKMAAEGKL
jgi:hypothetical protein